MKLICFKSAMLLLLLIGCMNVKNAHTQGEELAAAKEIYEGAKMSIEFGKKEKELISNGCIANDNCFTGVAINNYCCTFQCCNAVTYIFKDELV